MGTIGLHGLKQLDSKIFLQHTEFVKWNIAFIDWNNEMEKTWNEQFVVLGTIKRPKHEADYSHSTNIHLKNKWSLTFHYNLVSAVTLTTGTSWM